MRGNIYCLHEIYDSGSYEINNLVIGFLIKDCYDNNSSCWGFDEKEYHYRDRTIKEAFELVTDIFSQ